MKHLGTKIIETERLILRRCAVEDAEFMYRDWASDPEVTKYLTWPVHGSADISRMVIDSWIADYEKEDTYQWMITLKDQPHSPIGSISVVSQNADIRKAEIGYCIGKAWWHQGIVSEALQAVMDFLFDEVGMNRIEARYDSRNPHSGGVMKKCGMQYEGTLRQSDRNNQGICDACVYALLKQERQNRFNTSKQYE
jgi:ribosomal-protein-alanine N-acetyltransferase